jgi:antitoxin YefM
MTYAMWYAFIIMSIYTASQFRKDLYNLVDSVAETHEPAHIIGKRNKVVVIAEEDYAAMQETLYLLSIPGMRESILEARAEPHNNMSDKLDW